MKVTGKLNRFYLALCVFSGCNLLFSASLAQAPVSVTGSLGIIECTEDICLTMSPPGALTFGSAPHFLNNDGERLTMITNPLTEDGLLRVTDSRPTGYFDIMVDITDLTSAVGGKVPKTNIGIMSFNENPDENISMDSVPEDSTVVSLIDPDKLLDPDETNRTYNDILSNPEAILEDWVTPFPSTGGVLIVSADDRPRHNAYTMGLAFFIQIPVNPANQANPNESLRDGHYEATATFTLITT